MQQKIKVGDAKRSITHQQNFPYFQERNFSVYTTSDNTTLNGKRETIGQDPNGKVKYYLFR